MNLLESFSAMNYLHHVQQILRVFAQDVAHGFALIFRNGFAIAGFAFLCLLTASNLRPDLREIAEIRLITWLEARQYANTGIVSDVDAADRATAIYPHQLNREQARIAIWLSRKYRIATEPLSALVSEAYDQGAIHQIDPTLILAVMAIESNFNPFAQSAVGAQGLMQVMTKIHAAKYTQYGGELAAFDPITNLRVGILVLRDCIKIKGSVEGGLRYYVGGGPDNDGGYVGKVLTEQKRIQLVAQGQSVPTSSTSALQIMLEKTESWPGNPFSFKSSSPDGSDESTGSPSNSDK